MKHGRKPGRRLITVGVISTALVLGVFMIFSMPGKSHTGPLAPLTDEEQELATRMHAHVSRLAGEFSQRSPALPERLHGAAAYIENTLSNMGYETRSEEFEVHGTSTRNIEVELRGREHPERIVIVGAHYDSVPGTPGADDNASGVAGALELARSFRLGPQPLSTIRFVFFSTEEPPFFKTADMGSYRYAMRSKELGEDIRAMVCLESIGFYTDQPGSQSFPPPLGLFYPDQGNFIAFVSNWKSRSLLHAVIRSFRQSAGMPSEGLVAPLPITGTDWSDHWSFWQAGYRAIMVTDTAPFRNPFYHSMMDTPERLDYGRMARVVTGLRQSLVSVAELM